MKWLMFVLALVVIAAAGMPVLAQSAPAIKMGSVQITGVPEDWSFHHLVFSDPGSAQDAIQSGRFDEWLRPVNEPRYILQQLKRHSAARGPWATEVDHRESLRATFAKSNAAGLPKSSRGGRPGGPPKPPKSTLKQDWSQLLTANAVMPNTFPAKYTFNTIGAPSCSDFVVFPTGYGSTSDASIVAYYNLYEPYCSGPNPKVWGAYNTYSIAAGSVTTSPVLSSNGTMMAYIQGSGTAAYLIVLKMPSGGETSSAIRGPNSITSVSTGMDCTAPCATVTSLSDATSGDTYSSPYYDYTNDAIYVGDNNGYLYKISPVFNSTNSHPPSALSVQLNSTSGDEIASPVLDAVSGCVFVGDTLGYLYSVNSGVAGTVCTSPTFSANTTSAQLGGANDEGIFDGVLVDSSAQTVYAFVADSGGGTGNCASGSACVVQFTTTITAGGLPNGSGALGTGGTNYNLYAGTFDNVYFSSSSLSSPSGNLYVIGNVGATSGGAALYQVPISSNTLGTPVSAVTVNSSHPGWATPVTEFCNNGGSACAVTTGGSCGTNVTCTTSGIDSVYFSVYYSSVGPLCLASSGNGCVLAYDVNSTTPTLTGTAEFVFPGTTETAGCWGTSAIIIDNNASTTTYAGASQVYFMPFSGEPPSTAPSTCGGNDTGGSAIALQISQITLGSALLSSTTANGERVDSSGSFCRIELSTRGLPSFRAGSLRDGADSVCLCWASGLQPGDTVELVLRGKLSTGDYFLYGGSNEHKFRYKQHAELGDHWRDQYRHHARNVHVHISEWFNEREPNGDDHLHADCHQCGRLDYVYAYRYSNDGEQTNYQLVHSEPHKYYFGLQQYAELGDDWRDQYRHHARNIHVHISEWLNEREPNGDDHLHVDCHQCGRLNYVDGNRSL